MRGDMDGSAEGEVSARMFESLPVRHMLREARPTAGFFFRRSPSEAPESPTAPILVPVSSPLETPELIASEALSQAECTMIPEFPGAILWGVGSRQDEVLVFVRKGPFLESDAA